MTALTLTLAGLWFLLGVGALQDLHTRQLAPWVVWPMLGLALGYRVTAGGGLLPWLWALGWLAVGYAVHMGGADAKVSAALALVQPRYSMAAWVGVGAWCLILWTMRREQPGRCPAVPGLWLGLTIAALWL